MEKREISPVSDYWQFMRELKAQFKAVELLKDQLFQLDDVCECAIGIDGDKDVGMLFSNMQTEVYDALLLRVSHVHDILKTGRVCFKLEPQEDGALR